MQKVLTLRLVVKDDGSVALERAAGAVGRLGKQSTQTAAATRLLDSAQARHAATALRAAASVGRLASMLGGIIGAGTLGLLVRETYQYNQQLESTKIGIAGLLSANRDYLGTQDQWGAALAESSDLLRRIQVESLKTKATVPQLGDAFATTFGAATAAGIRATNEEMLTMTTRLTQVGNAFGVVPEQMRQEINSLLSGMITEDSLIARRLGFDNKSVKQMVANGTIVAEIIRRTEAYAKAAEAQSNTLSGKLLNTREIIVATLSRGMEGAFKGLQKLLDDTFGWFVKNGPAVESAIQRGAAAIEAIVGKVVGWANANKDLIADVGATIAILGTLGIAISVLSSPITWTIAGVVALGLAWHKLSDLSGIEVDGFPIATYIRRTAQIVVTAWLSMIVEQVGAVKFLYHTTKAVFGSIAEAILSPLHYVVLTVNNMIQGIPESVAKVIPGFNTLKETVAGIQKNLSNAFTPLDNVKKGVETVKDTAHLMRELATVTMENVVGAGGKFAGPADLVKEAWGGAMDALRGLMPDLKKIGDEAAAKLFPSATKPGAVPKPGAKPGGDSQYDPSKFRTSIDKLFGRDAFAGDLERRGFSDGVVSTFVEKAIAMQRRVEDGRLGVIEDALEREYEMRLAQNEREYEADLLAAGNVQALLDQALAAKTQKDDEATASFKKASEEQKRIQREQLVGTKEWAAKMAREIGTVPDQVTRMIGESKLEFAGFFDGILNDFIDGQADIGKSFEDLAKNLAKTWGRMLSDMLTQTILGGESIVDQLGKMWDKLGSEKTGDRMIAGAGMGGLVGSFFQDPGNQAQLGGTIGGAIGAIWGPIGSVIGAAIGTAVGSLIQKGTDKIRVAIVDGVAKVTETGISAEARGEVETQIQRRVKEELKGWQSIIDLFPQTVKDHLDKVNWEPELNLTGGVKNADITDEGALNALSDFIGNKIPEAAFNAYKSGIQIALGKLGVSAAKIGDIFKYFATLQGKELQDAVRDYVTTLLDSIKLRDDLGAGLNDKMEIARKAANKTSLGSMADMRDQIGTLVASASRLTDIEDIVAAQRQITDLGRRYYEMGIARLQRIDQIEQSIIDTNATLKEQIDLAGMDDQQKVDYFYDRLGHLRTQLTKTTNEEEIAKIVADMQRYVQAAFGLAPDNAENREKLTAILQDITDVSTGRLQAAREAQQKLDEEVRDLQRKMLETLMGISDKLDPTKPKPEIPKDEEPDKPRRPGRVREHDEEEIDPITLMLEEIRGGSAVEVAAIQTLITEVQKSAINPDAVAKAIAAELARLLNGMQVSTEEPIVINNGDLGNAIEQRVTRTMQLYLQDNPDAYSPRS